MTVPTEPASNHLGEIGLIFDYQQAHNPPR
jgi:hypothetical protein